MKINKIYQVFKLFFKIAKKDCKIDSYFRLQDFASTLNHFHFDSRGISNEDKKRFFQNQLEEIELETHGYCNRKCEFCPNFLINRTDKNQILPEQTFKRLIDELSKIAFHGTLKFHRYNEPLALDIIFDRINYARKKLPNAIFGLHSNGDYVTANVLKKCEQYGLNFLYISHYVDFKISDENPQMRAKKHCEDYLRRRKLNGKRISRGDDLVRYIIPMEKMRVIIFVPDIMEHGDDRGGFLEFLKRGDIRTSPCISPFRRMYVDWTGDVLPCCNLRGDIDAHKDYVLGNIKNSTLQDVFFSDTSNSIRKMLSDFSKKQGSCKYCKFDLFYSNAKAKKFMEETIKKLKLCPR
jgi:radical SAM protein with 4Fe4S-binding SPASM domain